MDARHCSPEARLTALLLVEGPMTFRRIIAAHEVRSWPTGELRATMTRLLRANVIGENREIEYYLK